MVTPYIAPENESVYVQYRVQVESRDDVQRKLKEHRVPAAVHPPGQLNY